MLSFSEIRKIEEIFQGNGWDPKAQIFHRQGLNLFDAVSAFIARIKPDERNIIFNMLPHYEIINDYHRYGRILWSKLNPIIDKSKYYYISPVSLPDAGRIKSGASFCYDVYSFFPKDKFQNIEFVDSPFSSDITLEDDGALIFVDDFVGTGDQFLEMYEIFAKKFGKPETCILLVIRIQDDAYQTLSKFGVTILADQIRMKAITSGRAIGAMSIDEARKVYLQIENEINVPARWGKKNYHWHCSE